MTLFNFFTLVNTLISKSGRILNLLRVRTSTCKFGGHNSTYNSTSMHSLSIYFIIGIISITHLILITTSEDVTVDLTCGN